MEPSLRRVADLGGGVVTVPAAVRAGITRQQLAAQVRSATLHRVRKGAYVPSHLWESAATDQRYRLTVAAVLASRGRPGFASHHAGLAAWRFPLHQVDLDRIDIAAPVRGRGDQGSVRVRPVPAGEALVYVDGVGACSAATCIVQTSATSGVAAGLVAADFALRAERVTREELMAAVARTGVTKGIAAVRRVISLANGLAESPGESLTRLIFADAGIAAEPQVVIRRPNGTVVARVDFLVGGRVVVEFDGAVKYAGADGRDALVREKRREDELRAMGYQVVRLTWTDLGRPRAVATSVRRALEPLAS